MKTADIIAAIDQELSKLQRVRELLNSSNGYKALAVKAGVAVAPKKRVMSEEARNRIALAQKKRWARQRKAAAAGPEKK